MLTTYVVSTMARAGVPAAIIGTATNCEAPAKTSTDIPSTWAGVSPACTARPPKTVPYTNTDGTSASEATTPCRTRSRKEQALHEPGESDGGQGQRAGPYERRLPAPASCPRENRQHRHDDQRLSDLDADIEADERPGERGAWQRERSERTREAESVDEAEGEADEPPVPRPSKDEVLDGHPRDRRRDDRLDHAVGQRHGAADGQCQRHAVCE